MYTCHVYIACYVRVVGVYTYWLWLFFFFQAEDGIRDLVRSRGLGDVYKRQPQNRSNERVSTHVLPCARRVFGIFVCMRRLNTLLSLIHI